MSHPNINPELLPFLDALVELLVENFPSEPEASDAGAPPRPAKPYHGDKTRPRQEEPSC